MKHINSFDSFINEAEDNAAAEAQAVFDSIDWKSVTDVINKTLGLNLKYEFKLIKRRNDYGVEMTSPNIIDKCGIFKYAIGECYVNFFNNWLMTDTAEYPDMSFSANVHLSYPGNGMELFGIIVNRKTGKCEGQKPNPRTSR